MGVEPWIAIPASLGPPASVTPKILIELSGATWGTIPASLRRAIGQGQQCSKQAMLRFLGGSSRTIWPLRITPWRCMQQNCSGGWLRQRALRWRHDELTDLTHAVQTATDRDLKARVLTGTLFHTHGELRLLVFQHVRSPQRQADVSDRGRAPSCHQYCRKRHVAGVEPGQGTPGHDEQPRRRFISPNSNLASSAPIFAINRLTNRKYSGNDRRLACRHASPWVSFDYVHSPLLFLFRCDR